ncbi:MAG: hypothetical protein CR994_03745 [Maribacter sp.]|nr:MAG: hypothetical protein CR994_03745 [Maribacter sp.]
MENRYCFLLIALLSASCQAVRVQTDYEKGTDFSNYTTYDYYDGLDTGLGGLEEKRLIRIFDVAMQGKGLLLSEEPDFFVNIQSEVYQARNNNTVGLGIGGVGGNIGGGVSVGVPVGQAKVQREIIFDFVDSQNGQLFWQAKTSSGFNEKTTPMERELELQEIVGKMLSKYPPKPKK